MFLTSEMDTVLITLNSNNYYGKHRVSNVKRHVINVKNSKKMFMLSGWMQIAVTQKMFALSGWMQIAVIFFYFMLTFLALKNPALFTMKVPEQVACN